MVCFRPVLMLSPPPIGSLLWWYRFILNQLFEQCHLRSGDDRCILNQLFEQCHLRSGDDRCILNQLFEQCHLRSGDDREFVITMVVQSLIIYLSAEYWKFLSTGKTEVFTITITNLISFNESHYFKYR